MTAVALHRGVRRGSRTAGWPPLAVAVGVLASGLALVGLVMVLSASSVADLRAGRPFWATSARQLVAVVLGGVAATVTATVDHRRWRPLARPLMWAATAACVVVLIPGVGVVRNGGRRWIAAGPVDFQPSEMAKLALILWVAHLLDRRRNHLDRPSATLVPVLTVTVTVAGLLVLEPDYGTTVTILAAVAAMLFVSGIPARHLAVCGSAGAVAAGLLAVVADYRRDRITAFLDPWADPLGEGYHTIQSLVGVASGGIDGVGLGASRAKWGFLPNAHTDFIFTIIGEELGLLGGLAVLAALAALVVCGIGVALRARDTFGALVATGVTAWIATQAVINIGGTLGALPISGITLPYVSFGGTSLVVLAAATGIVVNIARHGRPTRVPPP